MMMTRLQARLIQVTPAIATALLWGAALADQPRDRALGFQEPASPIMDRLEGLHNHLLLTMCVVIVLFVLALLLICIFRYNRKANPTPASFHHNTLLEVVWTGIPVLILIAIAIPSFKLLHDEEVTPEADLTIKAIGSQWYWDYEYPDKGGLTFTSKMLTNAEDDAQGKPHRLGVDQPIYVPVGKTVRVIVTAADVIHSWAIPAFGVKMDAVPGRLNDTWFLAEREGVFYGQCSELCGAKHAFMPIEVHVVSQAEFDDWINKMEQEFGSNEAPSSALAENR